ncbi:hypothetical protein, partial [Pseudomonas aeruginosa]|uniref:hypothetical protein n=1 Tax=Pseudomonas aeruginosa TaxID=287 RepID=UPI001BFF839B
AGLRTQKLQLFYQQLNGLLFGVENLLVIWLGATMVMANSGSTPPFARCASPASWSPIGPRPSPRRTA